MASPPYWSPSPPPLAPGDAVANSIWRASIGRAVGTINCLTNFSTKLISFALSTEHEQRPHHWAVTKGVRRAPPPPHGGGGGWVGKFVVIAIQDVSSTLPSDRERDVTRPAGEWRRVRSSGCNYNWLSVYGSVGHCPIQARALDSPSTVSCSCVVAQTISMLDARKPAFQRERQTRRLLAQHRTATRFRCWLPTDCHHTTPSGRCGHLL